MSSSNCCFLTCIQFSQEAGQVVWYSHLLKNFPQFDVIHTVKALAFVNKEVIVSKAEVNVFLELSCFFHDSVDVGNLISGSSAFSKSSLNIWSFMVHMLLKPGLENFEHYFTSVWDECNCAVLWTFFGIAFFRDWNENWLFSVLWPMLSFPNLLAYWWLYFSFIPRGRPELGHLNRKESINPPLPLLCAIDFQKLRKWVISSLHSISKLCLKKELQIN